MTARRRLWGSPRALGWLLALAATALALGNQREVGIARDEVVYMVHGGAYADWWIGAVTGARGLDRASIERTFGGAAATANNREHPPLMKTLSGLSHRALHRGLGLDELTAYRLPAALAYGALVALVFGIALTLWGTAHAVIAALLVIGLPRVLFHASLACFDVPIATLWLASVVAYWRCLDGRRWPWQAGVVLGLALATKHNAVMLPVVLGLHHAIAGYRAGGWRGVWAYRPRVLASLAILGPLTLVALWPWLWLDPIGHAADWIGFHLRHVHYHYEYLGTNWNAPPFPWHVPIVTTLLTVPTVTIAAALIGVAGAIVRNTDRPLAGRDPRMPVLLLALSAAVSVGPFMLGSTPIFGAEKHWMPALPSLCLAAAAGVVTAARWLAAALPLGLPRARRAALPVLAGLVVAAAGVEVWVAQPYALTWYSALAGGAPGGADLGMNRQFWGVAARGALPVLAAAAPPPGDPPRPVYTHDALPAWPWYRRHGRVPASLPDAGHEGAGGIERSQLAIVIHERHFLRHDYLIWAAYGTTRPIAVIRAAGVPVVSVYARPAAAPPGRARPPPAP